MILFFDTETTGFYLDRLPPDHVDQPHIVQLAAKLCDDTGNDFLSFNFIVKPTVSIPSKASDVHGIDDDKASQFGVSPSTAVQIFRDLYTKADLVCAHNVNFDQHIIETAIAREYGKHHPLTKQLFCTMEAATPIVNLPPTERMIACGFNKPKPPKLEECIKHFFGEELNGAHDAMVDVDACKRVYFHLKSQVM